ncbi:hypothetical protein [Bradyrhizobium sp. LMG 9283]|uniref:hypothetical protein n=1 Tax=Bradyrhizobium sp. LMG 9283 TaxID=592064 RepID=UPI00388CF6FF
MRDVLGGDGLLQQHFPVHLVGGIIRTLARQLSGDPQSLRQRHRMLEAPAPLFRYVSHESRLPSSEGRQP